MEVCAPCKSKKRLADWAAANPERRAELRRKWAQENQDKDRKSKADWQKRNAVACAEKAARWRAANPEKAGAILRSHYQRNRDKCIQRVVDRTKDARTPAWADKDLIADLYRLARIASKHTGIEFHVDHIVPLRGKQVCGLHCQSNLQLLPADANRKKSNRLLEGNA
jgi:hypothetical protein